MDMPITPAEAARRLGVSTPRVYHLIAAKRLPATPFGRGWMIRPEDLRLVAVRKNGRPRKSKSRS